MDKGLANETKGADIDKELRRNSDINSKETNEITNASEVKTRIRLTASGRLNRTVRFTKGYDKNRIALSISSEVSRTLLRYHRMMPPNDSIWRMTWVIGRARIDYVWQMTIVPAPVMPIDNTYQILRNSVLYDQNAPGNVSRICSTVQENDVRRKCES